MAKEKKKIEPRAGNKKVTPSSAGTRAATTSKKESVQSKETSRVGAHIDDDDQEEPRAPQLPFRLLDLPPELRIRIYEEFLRVHEPIDLHPDNYRAIAPRLALFLVSQQIHREAFQVFYRQVVRLFPTHGRFFHTKKPLLQRLSPRYRSAITTMELRLGPGWSAPPRGQKITEELGLSDCANLRILKIFIEIDPSEAVFAGFRGKNATEETYKDFCVDLLLGIFERVPSLVVVELDAFPAVKRDAPLIVAIKTLVEMHQKILLWGSTREWSSNAESAMLVLESSMARMAITEAAYVVPVPA